MWRTNFSTNKIISETTEDIKKGDSVNKNRINNSEDTSDNSLDNSCIEIVEKYQQLIKNRKMKHKEEEENEKQKGANKYVEVLKNNESIYLDKNKREKQERNVVDGNTKEEDKSVTIKDEKYVILKKQITKAFIHQTFLPHVESQIIYHLKTYTPDQIVNIFHIYSYLYFYDKKKEMIDQLIQYLEYRLDCFSVQNVILVLEPLYILNQINNIYIYRLIINYLNKLKEQLNVYNYIGICRVFTKILIDIYCQENINNKHTFFITDLFRYLKYRKYSKKIPSEQKNIPHKEFIIEFMNETIEHVENQLQLLTAIELTDLLSVMANYAHKNLHSKYNLVPEKEEYKQEKKKENDKEKDKKNDKEKDKEHLEDNMKKQTTDVIENGKQIIIHNLTQNNAYVFKENIICFLIINELKKKYHELTTLHKIVNLHNLTKLYIYDESYIQLIEKDINNDHYICNIHYKYITLLIWCLFKLGILHKYINKLLPIVRERIFYFTGKELSRLCHCIISEKEILHKIAYNLIKRIERMDINEFLCYFYSVVLLDLLPYSTLQNMKKRNADEGVAYSNTCDSTGYTANTDTTANTKGMVISKKNEILQNCLQFINYHKKELGKEEITKIVLLLKKKKGDQYLYILDMLPEEWKQLITLIK